MRPSRAAVAVVGLAGLLAGCSGSGSDSASSGAPSSTTEQFTTTATTRFEAEVVGEAEVDGNYRQGIARSGDGWIFTTNNAIYRTDGRYQQTAEHLDAIPADLAAQGYDHLGDPDVADGLIWVPVERGDKSEAEQVTARYDEGTLEFVDAVVVAQHHNAFVGVDDGVAYSADEFSDDTIVRYRVEGGKAVALEPLALSQTVDRIQGGDVADGALWLSTDDDHNGVYRVDLATGAVQDLGSAGHIDGEGEGIDASALDGALLHVLVADEAIVPMWVVDLAATPTSR